MYGYAKQRQYETHFDFRPWRVAEVDVLKLNVSSDGVRLETVFWKAVDHGFLLRHGVEDVWDMCGKKIQAAHGQTTWFLSKHQRDNGRKAASPLLAYFYQANVYFHSSLCSHCFSQCRETLKLIFSPASFLGIEDYTESYIDEDVYLRMHTDNMPALPYLFLFIINPNEWVCWR